MSGGQWGGLPAGADGPVVVADPYVYPRPFRPYGSEPPAPAYLGFPAGSTGPHRGPVAGIVSLFVVLALVAVVAAVGRAHRDASAAADDAMLAAARARIVAELPRLQAWIAADRGLSWKRPVTPEVLSDKDFVGSLESGSSAADRQQPGDPEDVGTTFAAMGLVRDADSFYAADDAATAAGVIGYYDDRTDRLVVRGTRWTALMEYVLVHELTHAIQDQNFDLSRMDATSRTDDESKLTIRALVEGDAERVADDYYDEQTSAWQRQVDGQQTSAPDSSAPIVDVSQGIPYVFGQDFVQGLVDAGGNKAVDAAFKAPPTTSAQLLHPAQWLAGKLPTPSPPPAPKKPAGEVADIGALGQLGLWAAVEAADPHRSDTARLDGWAGDSYVSTDGDSGACFVDDSSFTSAATRATAVEFLKSWTDAEHIQVTLEGATDLRLSACRS